MWLSKKCVGCNLTAVRTESSSHSVMFNRVLAVPSWQVRASVVAALVVIIFDV